VDIKEVISKAMTSVTSTNGVWHFLLHFLVMVYSLHYGGFLQVFQAAVESRNILMDPKEFFQRSADLVELVLAELKRALLLNWAATAEAKAAYAVGALATSYAAYRDKLKSSSDEFLQYVLHFVEMAEPFQEFSDSIAVGDSINIEVLYLELLPFS
jgi:hypothetical protein